MPVTVNPVEGDPVQPLAFLGASPEPAVVVDADGHVVYANPNACRLLAYAAEVAIIPVVDQAAAILVVRDLTDRKRAARAESRLALVVRSSHEAIIAWT